MTLSMPRQSAAASTLTGEDALNCERAVETLSHQVAARVHLMLAQEHVTVAELKARLEALRDDTIDYVDDLLAAKNPHSITIDKLADVAFVLGYTWEVRILKMPTEPVPPQE